MRTALTVAVVLTGVSACQHRQADGPIVRPADTARYTAPLLRRLAEAVDGYYDGRDRLVVAGLKPPHRVLGVFLTDSASLAETIAKDSSSNAVQYEVFGPYSTRLEEVTEIAESVDSVRTYLADGKEKVYDGRKIDALFWGLSAFDDFIAPYFTAHYGVVEANRQRELYRQGKSPLANSQTIPHYRSSF